MHYCSAESYAVKTSLENILHMPHDSLPSAHFDLFGKERSITIRGYIAYNSFLSDFANNSKDPKKNENIIEQAKLIFESTQKF